MKKNDCFKTLMKCFAVLASVGGVLYLFKDKIKECPIFKGSCPLRKHKVHSDKEEKNDDFLDEDLEDDDCFDHAFDIDPATDREYVSLTISPSIKPDKKEEDDLKESADSIPE